MADEFDPCECIFSHEAAMQRLLTLLRQGQSYCTDTDCTDQPPLSNVDGPNPTDPGYYMLALWAVFAMVLFLMRPASTRSNGDRNALAEKPANAVNNNNNQPPPPPPAL